MRRLAASLLVATLTAAVAACGGSASPAPAASAAGGASAAAAGARACATADASAAAAVTVSIKDFAYTPKAVQAKVGDVVAWKNDDSAPHTATMDDSGCDTDTIGAGKSAMLVFTAAGTYTYHCTIHPTQMKDVTVEVK